MKPKADLTVGVTMVQALIHEQHGDLAHLPVSDAGEGWDNRLFRLGDGYAVRLPRRAASAALVEHEHRWLPQLSAALPLPIPAPHRVGRPGCGFPWAWSITSWFEGETALVAPPRDVDAMALALGTFVRAFHQPAPADAPRNPWRGVPLTARTDTLRDHLQRVGSLVDTHALWQLWERTVLTPTWSGAPIWIHGDLHPGNLLISEGRLSAVIDFGDLAAGDPATDLSIAWMVFPPAVRRTFLAAARGPFDPIDADTAMRARGWALALALSYLAHSRDDSVLAALGSRTLSAVLAEDDATGEGR
ncbi:MAG TPA: aminoglycoside phosphotransferase family protein [Vicinamibacterales bacterium]|nr:aminoglycoside phosphotransferase family protein [Vicinamibacterales bacterium]